MWSGIYYTWKTIVAYEVMQSSIEEKTIRRIMNCSMCIFKNSRNCIVIHSNLTATSFIKSFTEKPILMNTCNKVSEYVFMKRWIQI